MIVGVFVPSLIGVGILVSGAVLLADVLRRYVPERGLRRRHNVAMGAYNVVNEVAAWAGREVSAGELLDRAPRRRITYAAFGAVCAIAAVVVPNAFLAAYWDELGLFHRSPWMIALSVVGAVGFALGAIVMIATALLASTGFRPVDWLVANTAVGRLQVPDPLPFEDKPEGASCAEH